MTCPTHTARDIIIYASIIRCTRRRFDTVVVANIIIFTALLALKRDQVLNVRVRQVMNNNQIIPDPIINIKGQYQYVNGPIPLPLEYRRRMQEYLYYLKNKYNNFGPNMYLFPNKNGKKYNTGKLTRHLEAASTTLDDIKMTLGDIRKSGICNYYQFLRNNRHSKWNAIYNTADFSGHQDRTIDDHIRGCDKPHGAGCRIW